MNHPSFVHLHLHSQFSLLESTVRLEPLMALLKEQHMPAVALTDKANLFGAIAFYQSALAHGLKPIMGCEIWISSNAKSKTSIREVAYPLVFLAENEAGFANLMKLSSESYLGEFQLTPNVNKAFLASHSQGLIVLSGGEQSEINSLILKDEMTAAVQVAEEYRDLFGKDHFYLEIQNHHQAYDAKVQKALAEIAAQTGISLVATNDVKYLKKEEADFHEVLLCLGKGEVLSDPKHGAMGSSDYYLKSAHEMREEFAEFPGAVERTLEIAERCHVSIEFGKTLMPAFPVPEKEMDENAYLEKICREGLIKRYGDKANDPAVQNRLKEELGIIQKTGFSGYFLIVWDFIAKAKTKHIPVGPGRGSAAGSLVSYVTGITDVDPIRYDLLFERFINPERVSAPDIDVDVCDRRRGEVLRYMTDTYGKDRVASIVTFGTMAAKAALRDVGRVLEIPLPEVDRITKLIPSEPKITLEDAMERVPELRAIAHEHGPYRKLWDVSRALEGLVRHVSTHAAGIIIGNEPLLETIPVVRGTENDLLSQYDMNALKDVGLLKLDILGLRTLSVIDDALQLIERHRKIKLDLSTIPLDDRATYKLLSEAKTLGLFQLESRGMRDYIRKLEPSEFEDLIALNALYRPGPLGSDMVDDFIHRRKGLVKVQYLHPKLEPILKTTYGVIVYQEQVMRIAKDLAGFTLGQADLLRRAMGSKNSEKMEQMRSKFLAGAHEAKINAETADAIFDHMAKFAGYGFNKSHSAAYSLLVYQTAYLKTHFTPEFMASLLTSESGNQDKISQYIFECKKMGIKVLPPDMNQSADVFDVTPEGAIRFSLSAIKNVGTPSIEAVLKARQAGPYPSLFDFCQRVDLKSFTPKMLESLISAGAFDFTQSSRAVMKAAVAKVFRQAQVDQADSQTGQTSLFESKAEAPKPALEVPEESPAQVLMAEKELLGFYLSGHPLSEHEWELEHYVMPLNELDEMPNGFDVRIAGLIRGFSKSMAKKSKEMYARFIIEDLHSHAEVIAWPETYKKYENLLGKDKLVGLKGRLDKSGDRIQVIANEIIDMNDMAVKWAKGVKLRVNVVGMDESLLPQVKAICEKYKGDAKVYFYMQTTHHGLMVLEAERIKIKPSKAFFNEVYTVLGDDSIEIEL
ncbi:MAG TPA: DNA polymerase III subunit alpha [bacterium]|jgi:DNA polymerase-3 subunit alpha|nr:DNA polymerase III subunit alpha [bacterium]